MLNRAQANLATARRDLRMVEQQFYMANPVVAPRPSMEGQAFFSAAGHR